MTHHDCSCVSGRIAFGCVAVGGAAMLVATDAPTVTSFWIGALAGVFLGAIGAGMDARREEQKRRHLADEAARQRERALELQANAIHKETMKLHAHSKRVSGHTCFCEHCSAMRDAMRGN